MLKTRVFEFVKNNHFHQSFIKIKRKFHILYLKMTYVDINPYLHSLYFVLNTKYTHPVLKIFFHCIYPYESKSTETIYLNDKN